MDDSRGIRHPGDEDEGARWACGVRQQLGPVEIASGPAPTVLRLVQTRLSASFGGGIFFIAPLVGAASRCAAAARYRRFVAA